MPLWRGYKQYVYHTCARCGFRQPLSAMAWQNGLLICKITDCIDKRITGSRDIDVARTVGVNRHELEPDPKLTQPTDRKSDIDEVLY